MAASSPSPAAKDSENAEALAVPGSLGAAEDICSARGSGQISAAEAKALWTNGYVVIEGFLGEMKAAALRSEALELAKTGRIPAHRFQFGASQFVKPHIFEVDLHDESLRESLPEFADLFFEDALVDSISCRLPELALARGPPAKTLKLQHNRGGGGCFPWHYDNAGKPSKRAVTCAVYLNPDWHDDDGGELVLQPFLRPQVVLPPVMDRAVLFLSDRVLHRVLPSSAERLCFTIWLDGGSVNRAADCNLTTKHLALTEPSAALEDFACSPVQRAVSRAVYAEEYEVSLQECMAGTPGCAEMLAEHQIHVERQQAHPHLGPFVRQLRELKGCL